jgi:hypothetical protein
MPCRRPAETDGGFITTSRCTRRRYRSSGNRVSRHAGYRIVEFADMASYKGPGSGGVLRERWQGSRIGDCHTRRRSARTS